MRGDADLAEFVMYAYIGDDKESGLGIKAAITPVGLIPLAAVDPLKLDRAEIRQQLQEIVELLGEPIRFVRLAYVTTIFELVPGGPG